MTRASSNNNCQKSFLKKAWYWFSSKIKKVYNYVKGTKETPFPKSLKNLQRPKLSHYRKYVRQRLTNKSSSKSKSQIQKRFQQYLKQRLIKDKQDQFGCPICLQIVIYPSSTLCGHTFCYKCLQNSLIFSQNCPVCRTAIRTMQIIPCYILQKLIYQKSSNLLTQNQIENYLNRHKEMTKWKQQRTLNISNLAIGKFIDVRDTQYIWCKAQIKQIFYTNKQPSSILVHYKGWNKIYDQILEVKSSRLAPFMFFSNRKDIPRYSLSQSEQNMRGAVIIGQQERPPSLPPQPNRQDQIAVQFHNRLRNNQHRPTFLRIGRERPQQQYGVSGLLQLFSRNELAIEIQQNQTDQVQQDEDIQIEQESREENFLPQIIPLPSTELHSSISNEESSNLESQQQEQQEIERQMESQQSQ